MENRCICCGEVIPEGRQVCWACENHSKKIMTNEELFTAVEIEIARITASGDSNSDKAAQIKALRWLYKKATDSKEPDELEIRLKQALEREEKRLKGTLINCKGICELCISRHKCERLRKEKRIMR